MKRIAQYLHETIDCGIKYKQSVDRNKLARVTLNSDVVPDADLPPFPVDSNQPNKTDGFC